jgi:hypothetical protein
MVLIYRKLYTGVMCVFISLMSTQNQTNKNTMSNTCDLINEYVIMFKVLMCNWDT